MKRRKQFTIDKSDIWMSPMSSRIKIKTDRDFKAYIEKICFTPVRETTNIYATSVWQEIRKQINLK